MAQYFVQRRGRDVLAERVNFEEFSELVQGTAIAYVSDRERAIELSLSEGLRVIVRSEENLLQLTLDSPQKEDEVLTARIQIISGKTPAYAQLVERRLRALRQIYAIIVLLESDRHEELAKVLNEHPDFDLEELLQEGDRLLVEAAGSGSFWATVGQIGKQIGKAPRAAIMALSCLFKDGRTEVVKYVNAVTRAKEAGASLKEAQAAKA